MSDQTGNNCIRCLRQITDTEFAVNNLALCDWCRPHYFVCDAPKTSRPKKSQSLVVSFTIPRLVMADDYHDFHEMKSFLSENLGLPTVTVEELGMVDDCYLGVMFDKNYRPTVADVRELLKNEGEFDKLSWDDIDLVNSTVQTDFTPLGPCQDSQT